MHSIPNMVIDTCWTMSQIEAGNFAGLPNIVFDLTFISLTCQQPSNVVPTNK